MADSAYYNKSLSVLAFLSLFNSVLSLFTLKIDEINLTNFFGLLNLVICFGTFVYMFKVAFKLPTHDPIEKIKYLENEFDNLNFKFEKLKKTVKLLEQRKK